MPYVYRPRLRILIDGVYIQQSNLSGSSTYNKIVSLVQELVKRGHFVYWMIPDVDYTPHAIEDHPQVGVVRTQYIQDQFIIDGLVTPEFWNLFNRISGKYHIDALVTARTGLALYYRRLLEAPRFHDNDDNKPYTDKSYGLPTVILEGFPQTRKRQFTSKSYSLMQLQGYLGADTTVFLSDHNREEITKEMLTWFRTSVVSNWCSKQTAIIPSGIRHKELDKHYSRDRYKLEKGFKVLSIGRLFGASYIEYLPWFDYLYRHGEDVSLTISLSGGLGGPMRGKLKNIGFDFRNNFGRQFRVIERNPRKNFVRMLKSHHAFLCPVSHYDQPAALWEAVYLGLPGVMPISDYQQTFFKNWPWVIKSNDKAGMLANLLWIRDNQEEARRLVLPFKEEVAAKYDAVSNNCRIADVVEVAARTHINRFKTSKGVIDLLKELKGEKYTWPDVVAYLRKSGRLGVSVGNMKVRVTFTYARGAIHHAMGLANFVDDCKTPEEKFIRRDIFDKSVHTHKRLRKVK